MTGAAGGCGNWNCGETAGGICGAASGVGAGMAGQGAAPGIGDTGAKLTAGADPCAAVAAFDKDSSANFSCSERMSASFLNCVYSLGPLVTVGATTFRS